jgi:hypothetical protein
MPALRPVLLPEEALPLDPQQLEDALLVLAGTDFRVETSLQEYVFTPPAPLTGKKRPVRFVDSTLSHALAVLGESERAPERSVLISLGWRLAALARLIRSGVLEDWVSPTGLGQTAVPPVVIEVAATLPLAGRLEFDPASFLEALRSAVT